MPPRLYVPLLLALSPRYKVPLPPVIVFVPPFCVKLPEPELPTV